MNFGFLQLFETLKVDGVCSLPQILFPALRGFAKKKEFRSEMYRSIADFISALD